MLPLLRIPDKQELTYEECYKLYKKHEVHHSIDLKRWFKTRKSSTESLNRQVFLICACRYLADKYKVFTEDADTLENINEVIAITKLIDCSVEDLITQYIKLHQSDGTNLKMKLENWENKNYQRKRDINHGLSMIEDDEIYSLNARLRMMRERHKT